MKSSAGRARGAEAPEGDLCAVHCETCGIRRGQARRSTDDAVDIRDRAARRADEVMVVVSPTTLIAGWRPRRLYATKEAGIRQVAEHVVDRLHRGAGQRLAQQSEQGFSVTVRRLLQSFEESDAPACHAQSRIVELVPGIRCHVNSIAVIVNDSK